MTPSVSAAWSHKRPPETQRRASYTRRIYASTDPRTAAAVLGKKHAAMRPEVVVAPALGSNRHE
eukprot:8092329-Pyramimonas_sp.AAC.1